MPYRKPTPATSSEIAAFRPSGAIIHGKFLRQNQRFSDSAVDQTCIHWDVIFDRTGRVQAHRGGPSRFKFGKLPIPIDWDRAEGIWCTTE